MPTCLLSLAFAFLIAITPMLSGCGNGGSSGRIVQASVDGAIVVVPDSQDASDDPYRQEDVRNGLTTFAVGCSWQPTLPAYFVDATAGLDSNVGSEAKPYKTLQKAVSAMLKTSTKRIYLRRGTHYVTATLTLDSRANGGLITSYPCEWAVIDGGRRLTNWKGMGNQLYSTAVNDATSDLDLNAWGQRQRPATSAVYDPAEPHVSGWSMTGGGFKNPDGTHILDKFIFRSGALKQADLPSLTGVTVQTMSWDRQRDSWTTIQSIDWAQRIIYLNEQMQDRVEQSGVFRLLNNYRWIRQVGEFSWDWTPTTKTLYVRQADPAFVNNITLPMLKTIFLVKDAADLRLFNMTFQNTISRGQAIRIENSTRIRIGGNTFRIVGSAVKATDMNYSFIAGNTIEQTGETALDFHLKINNNKIYANTITNVGQTIKTGSGISLSGASDNLISNNTIANSSHYGISHKNWNKETINWRNRIEYNKVYNVCTDTGDCGAIETLGRSGNMSGVVIKGNFVERYNGLGGYPVVKGFKGWGLMIDDRSSGMTIEGNFVRNDGFAWAQIYIHGGDNNTVRNNFSVAGDSKNAFIRLQSVWDGYNPDGTRRYRFPQNNQVIRNVVYYKDMTPDYATYEGGGTVTVNYNLLYNTDRFFKNKVRQDANSLVKTGFPFDDVDAGLFRLRTDSGASSLGIKDIEWQKIGASKWTSTTELPRFW